MSENKSDPWRANEDPPQNKGEVEARDPKNPPSNVGTDPGTGAHPTGTQNDSASGTPGGDQNAGHAADIADASRSGGTGTDRDSGRGEGASGEGDDSDLGEQSDGLSGHAQVSATAGLSTAVPGEGPTQDPSEDPRGDNAEANSAVNAADGQNGRVRDGQGPSESRPQALASGGSVVSTSSSADAQAVANANATAQGQRPEQERQQGQGDGGSATGDGKPKSLKEREAERVASNAGVSHPTGDTVESLKKRVEAQQAYIEKLRIHLRRHGVAPPNPDYDETV